MVGARSEPDVAIRDGVDFTDGKRLEDKLRFSVYTLTKDLLRRLKLARGVLL